MRQLSEGEERIAKQVFEVLVGLTIEEAKEILKHVLVDLHKQAVIRGVDFNKKFGLDGGASHDVDRKSRDAQDGKTFGT